DQSAQVIPPSLVGLGGEGNKGADVDGVASSLANNLREGSVRTGQGGPHGMIKHGRVGGGHQDFIAAHFAFFPSCLEPFAGAVVKDNGLTIANHSHNYDCLSNIYPAMSGRRAGRTS